MGYFEEASQSPAGKATAKSVYITSLLRFVSTKAETEDPAGKKIGNGFARCALALRRALKANIKTMQRLRTLLRLLKRRRACLFQ
ncbi:MAG: hypothetical protein LRY73_03915 [Bacillus sp. (in: Bacteria)]|nr:hypothetical protein [Bacillus sp. (in: firmicutes)]